MKIKIVKTDWMRPSALARLLGTSPQNINYMINKGKVKRKVDRYGIVLVKTW